MLGMVAGLMNVSANVSANIRLQTKQSKDVRQIQIDDGAPHFLNQQ